MRRAPKQETKPECELRNKQKTEPKRGREGKNRKDQTRNEVIERSNARKIIGIEPTEDCIEWRSVESSNPARNGNTFGNNHQEKGTQHAGRLTWFRTKGRIADHHDAIHSGEIKISETQEDLPDGCRL